MQGKGKVQNQSVKLKLHSLRGDEKKIMYIDFQVVVINLRQNNCSMAVNEP